MWNRFYSLAKNRVVWLIGQLLVLCFLVSYIQQVYTTNILPDRLARKTFQPTQCLLMGKKLSTKGHLIQRYRADFLVTYHENGVQYNRWVSANGLDKGYVKNSSDQEDMLSQFEVGGVYPCRFDPAAAHQVMLVARRNWYSTLPAVVPMIVSVILFYYFSRALFRLIDSMMLHSRQKRRAKHYVD